MGTYYPEDSIQGLYMLVNLNSCSLLKCRFKLTHLKTNTNQHVQTITSHVINYNTIKLYLFTLIIIFVMSAIIFYRLQQAGGFLYTGDLLKTRFPIMLCAVARPAHIRFFPASVAHVVF